MKTGFKFALGTIDDVITGDNDKYHNSENIFFGHPTPTRNVGDMPQKCVKLYFMKPSPQTMQPSSPSICPRAFPAIHTIPF